MRDRARSTAAQGVARERSDRGSSVERARSQTSKRSAFESYCRNYRRPVEVPSVAEGKTIQIEILISKVLI